LLHASAGWVYLAFAFYHAAAFMLCFFHVLHADLYGFDKRINTFWCMFNFTLALFYLIGTLGNVLWFPSQARIPAGFHLQAPSRCPWP